MLKRINYNHRVFKRQIEDMIIYPFIWMGRFFAFLRPLQKEYKIYYFFSYFHIGGVEKVNYQVATCAGGGDAIIFFTKKSHNDGFLKEFTNTKCDIKDISSYTDNKLLYIVNFIFRGILSGYINNQKLKPKVFNGQCNLGYKISPWLNKEITQIELIHSFNSFSYIRTPFLPFYETTIMISQKRIKDHIDFYRTINVPFMYDQRIKYISNAIPIPDQVTLGHHKGLPFKVLFVGRNSPEKRIALIYEIGYQIFNFHPEIEFHFAGEKDADFNPDKIHVQHHGMISDEMALAQIYRNCHVLILTSETEGFPMTVIEAMMHGCAIIATPVGDLPYHIVDHTNGFLFSTVTDTKKIIEEGVRYVLGLYRDNLNFEKISLENHTYAKKHFSIDNFNSAYREILGFNY